MDITQKPRISSEFMLYKEDGTASEFFLFNIKEGAVFQINATSYDFLFLCNGEREIGEIFQELIKSYLTDEETLKNDFDGLIKQWGDLHIIV